VKLEKTEKAYKVIFKLLRKNAEFHKIDIKSLENDAEKHLLHLMLTEVYGLNLQEHNDNIEIITENYTYE